jgi:hypothetical protein
VQYPEQDIKSRETLLNFSITGKDHKTVISLGNLATLRRQTVPTEVTNPNMAPRSRAPCRARLPCMRT